MQFNNPFKRFEHRFVFIRRFAPAIAFVFGFVWDSVTMGKVVSSLDLLILTTYYLAAGLLLVLLVREIRPQWQNRLVFLIHFFFGGLFSALVVFYFKSSGSIFTFLVVIALTLLLVGNEFFNEKHRSRPLDWAMFAACGTMYLNFLLPHLVHSIKPLWFYLSCLISFAVVYVIHGFAYANQRESLPIVRKSFQYLRDLRQMAPAVGIVFLLVVLYQFQLIPPVPLVLKQSYLCKDFSNENGLYQCQAERQSFWRNLGLGAEVIHFQEGEKIYSMAAIFAPTRIAVDLEQRWWRRDEGNNAWLSKGVIPLSMTGGRKAGWRTYSYIQASVQSGEWRVETALQGGAVLAVDYFTAIDQIDPAIQTHTVSID